MIFELEVRPGQGSTDFFTPYKETVEANTSHDALARVKRRNPGCQVWVVNSYNAGSGGGGGYSGGGGGSGCGTLILIGIGLAILGAISGGESDKSPSERPQAAPVERIAEPYTPATPEPQFRDYASPPPSYCVTENFEPC